MAAQNLNRILYIEDEPDIQTVAKLALETIGGYVLEVCSSGSEAIAVAETFAPDLILLDVMMPGMDGPTTLKNLQEIKAIGNTPAIFMTAKVQADEVKQLKQCGAIDVIAKPFDPITLSETINGIWAKHKS